MGHSLTKTKQVSYTNEKENAKRKEEKFWRQLYRIARSIIESDDLATNALKKRVIVLLLVASRLINK